MSKINYFNKGTAIGRVVKNEIVKYEDKKTKEKKHFLSMEIDTMKGNRAKITMFPTKSNPTKDMETSEMFTIGSVAKVVGNVSENEFTTKSGQKGVERSIGANKIEPFTDEKDKYKVTFVLQGIVEGIKQIPDGVMIKISIDESYTDENGKLVEREPSMFNLQTTEDLIFEHDIAKGCNVKFKGQILNEVIYDDYDDVVGRQQMFKVEDVANVVQADELTDEDDDIMEDDPFK